MSTHTHLGLVCGEDPLDHWIRRLHSGWASYVNRVGRIRGGHMRGPLVADRPTTILVPDHKAPYLGAYIHNNPGRAGLVSFPEESSWTSHRAYIGLEPRCLDSTLHVVWPFMAAHLVLKAGAGFTST